MFTRGFILSYVATTPSCGISIKVTQHLTRDKSTTSINILWCVTSLSKHRRIYYKSIEQPTPFTIKLWQKINNLMPYDILSIDLKDVPCCYVHFSSWESQQMSLVLASQFTKPSKVLGVCSVMMLLICCGAWHTVYPVSMAHNFYACNVNDYDSRGDM